MNDPDTLAAAQDDDHRESPDTTGAAAPTTAEPIRTPPHTAGTCRPSRPAPARSGALRHVLRRPVAAALLVCGLLHLPGDVSALPSQAPTALAPPPRRRAVPGARRAAGGP